MKKAFEEHRTFTPIPQARVYSSVSALLSPAECNRIVKLATDVGLARATQSADPGLNRVLRVPVNGTAFGGESDRLDLLEIAFKVHARACAHAQYAYSVDIAPLPKWRPRRNGQSVRDHLLANVTEWNRCVKFNVNVLQYTTDGGNVGTTLHRDEAPLAYVVPLRRTNVLGGGTRYAFLGARDETLDPPAGTLVLHPGDASHQGVEIRAQYPSQGPGQRWVIAGFIDTAPRRKPPSPDPPITREGDALALSKRWGVTLPQEREEDTRGCHVGADGTPRYRKRDGDISALHLGSRGRSVYVNTVSRRSGRRYRYYVTGRCRKQRSLTRVLSRLRS